MDSNSWNSPILSLDALKTLFEQMGFELSRGTNPVPSIFTAREE